MENLCIIDGNSLINRAFYSSPISLKDKAGNLTNAVFGFTSMLLKIFSDIKPSHMVITFDARAKTFRHEIYSDYKGTRKGMPDELALQLPMLKALLAKMRITCMEMPGYEADDIIGTLSKLNKRIPTNIISGDNDLLQLIDDNTKVLLTKKGISELEIMDEQALMDKLNIIPSQIIELKALMGDSSDNIPGVAGVGEKTALSLLASYVDLDGVYNNLENVKGKLKDKLEAGIEMAKLSKVLATINVNVPLTFDLDSCKIVLPFDSDVSNEFLSLGFRSLLARTEYFGREKVAVESFEVEEVEIDDIAELKSVLESNYDKIAIDIAGEISFSVQKNKSYKIKIMQDLLSLGIDFDQALSEIAKVVENDRIKKVFFDIKKNMHFFASYGIKVVNAPYDVMLMQYVYDYNAGIQNVKELQKIYDAEKNNSAGFLYNVSSILYDKLNHIKLYDLYFNVERKLLDILFDMEIEGFKADDKVLIELKEMYYKEIGNISQEIYFFAGREFNINSPKQLSEILYDELNLKSLKKTKTGRSTNAEVLEELMDEHPIIAPILRYRQVSKLLSTYVEGLLAQIKDDSKKIHTIFNQAVTVTGRLSSSEPNLQNIPIRTKEGNNLRKVFISGSSDRVLVAADYSQIELRLLAHFCGDEKLINAFNDDADIHRVTAASVFGVAEGDVTTEMRRAAKAVNFGIIYGISDFGLARQLGISNKKSSEYIKLYFEKYPQVKEYMNKNVEMAKTDGYISTITGRRRVIPELKSPNYNVRSFGERAAMNMPLQGSSADIIKIAMINVFERLKVEGLKSKLILQVHDELIIDALITEQEAVEKLLKEEMENVYNLRVPLKVNVGVGKSWYYAK